MYTYCDKKGIEDDNAAMSPFYTSAQEATHENPLNSC